MVIARTCCSYPVALRASHARTLMERESQREGGGGICNGVLREPLSPLQRELMLLRHVWRTQRCHAAQSCRRKRVVGGCNTWCGQVKWTMRVLAAQVSPQPAT